MIMNSKTLWLVTALICCCIWSALAIPKFWIANAKRPAYIECASSDECTFDSCCVLGMDRYSTPICQKKLQLHDNCRLASEEPVNSTVAYPDGQVVSLHKVHLIMCPCADGLSCDYKSRTCVNFDDAYSFNELNETPNRFDD